MHIYWKTRRGLFCSGNRIYLSIFYHDKNGVELGSLYRRFRFCRGSFLMNLKLFDLIQLQIKKHKIP